MRYLYIRKNFIKLLTCWKNKIFHTIHKNSEDLPFLLLISYRLLIILDTELLDQVQSCWSVSPLSVLRYLSNDSLLFWFLTRYRWVKRVLQDHPLICIVISWLVVTTSSLYILCEISLPYNLITYRMIYLKESLIPDYRYQKWCHGTDFAWSWGTITAEKW